MDGVIGVVTCFAGNFIPKNWMACNGQSLSVNSNKALFTIIGNAFGGDGVNNFNLPDLRGRAPVSPGVGSGKTQYKLGANAGSETVLIKGSQLPQHTHTGAFTLQLQCCAEDGIDPSSDGGYPSRFTGAYSPTANCTMAKPPNNFEVNYGASEPAFICSPYLVINYIICIAGIFPTRG